MRADAFIIVFTQAAIFYSARIGLGWDSESNGLRQTSLISARPTVAAVQLCAPLLPKDFASGEEMAAAAQRAIVEAYTQLEQRYKGWPAERLPGAQ